MKHPEQPAHFKAGNAEAFETEERCHITEWLNDSADEALSIARAEVAPGVTTSWHRLNGVTERYLMLSGEGEAEIEGLGRFPARPGDVILIPPGHAQRIQNAGQSPLVFAAICTPRFSPDCYEDLEHEMA